MRNGQEIHPCMEDLVHKVLFSSPLGGDRCFDSFDERCNKTKSDADPRGKRFSFY